MYKLINQNIANRLKEILELTALYKEINMEVGNFVLKVSAVSETNDTEHYPELKMKEIYLLDDKNKFDVLEFKNKKYEVFMNIGDWGYETRLKDVHITLGSKKFHGFCFQLELSQAITDGKYVYIVKNVSNMAGQGAMCRLYRGLKHNRAEKLKRQQSFIERFGSEIIKYEEKDWIVISKISVQDLYDDDKAEEIFYKLVYNMFFAMLLVESITINN